MCTFHFNIVNRIFKLFFLTLQNIYILKAKKRFLVCYNNVINTPLITLLRMHENVSLLL